MRRLSLHHLHLYFPFLFASLFMLPAARADVCDPNALQGAYGFSLTGNTTIGGATRPVVVVGRLVFEESGDLSGISSVAFTGLILGNPVTGKYEAKTDCSVTWSLQDDSGNLQHFDGTMSDDGAHVTFRQSDAGGAQNGVLRRTPEACSVSSLAGDFSLSLSGSTVDVDNAVEIGRRSLSGLLMADGAGGLSFATGPDGPTLSSGTYDVQDDCFVAIELELPAEGDVTAMMHFRAILVENSHEVLGIQTDPGTSVAFRLVSR
jgi:hypothetical protein